MIKDTIPPESLMVGQPIAVNILKYCVEHGMEKGFTPIAPITITVDGNSITYQEAKEMTVTKDIEITLFQFQ